MPKTMEFPRRPCPPVARIQQHLPGDRIADPRAEVRSRLEAFDLATKLHPGARVAITAGSRGIGGFIELLSGIVDAVKSAGAEPFIIPAMGSHGGATPEGQTQILRLLGVNDAAVGAPVRATMDTVALGPAENGAIAHMDRFASEADGIVVLGRTKTHPESTGPLASGLLKMSTIGLGKQAGAQSAHNHGLWESVRAVPKVQLAKSKFLCGVAVVENGYRQPAVIEVVPPTYDAFLEADLRLLDVAKTYFATVPFETLDVLVVDEIGKTVSGGGMDPNVIGRYRSSRKGPHIPDFKRIVALSLTPPSLGNGLGIGMADFTTRRFAESYDPATTYVNLLTATEPGSNTGEGPLPLVLPNDREAIEVALYSSLAGERPRLCRIKDTAMLGELWASEALMDEVRANPKLTVVNPPAPMPFDAGGNLF